MPKSIKTSGIKRKKGDHMYKPEKILDNMWQLLDSALRESLADGISQAEIAKTIGVSQGSISKWLDGQRRDGVRFISVLKMLDSLGVSMDEVAKVIFKPDHLAAGLKLLHSDPDAFDMIIEILDAGGQHYEKLISEIKYICHQVRTEKE